MVINKPRHRRGRGGRGRRTSLRGRRRDKNHHQRTDQEQLDYEIELVKAQRENREEKFKQEEREKLRAKRAARLDDDMDDYFSKRSQKVEQPETDAAKEKTPPVQSEQNKTEASAQEQSAPEQSLPEQPAAST